MGDVDSELPARWARAEDSLYAALLLSEPSTYVRVVELVGALAAYLHTHATDVAELVAAARRGLDLVAEVDPGGVTAGIPAAAALDAACAIRHRELGAAESRHVRAAAVSSARAAGQIWAELVGPVSPAGLDLAPTLHVHVATGAAISCRAEMDIDTGGVVFVVSPVGIDPATGSMCGGPPSLGSDRTAASPRERDQLVQELRACVEHLDSEDHLV